MNLLGWLVGLVMLLVLAAVLYPLAAPYLNDGRRDAYRRILSVHTPAHAPQRNKQMPLLYLSDFSAGDPKHAEETIIYPDGWVASRRVLWNNAVQGGGGQTRNSAALQALKALPPLPPGLLGPDAVEYKNLLIVSQESKGHWNTFYYDRSHLPAPVQKMQSLVTAASQP